MATNMFPSINQAPLGLDALPQDIEEGPGIEIEIENPEGVRIGLDGMEIVDTLLDLQAKYEDCKRSY